MYTRKQVTGGAMIENNYFYDYCFFMIHDRASRYSLVTTHQMVQTLHWSLTTATTTRLFLLQSIDKLLIRKNEFTFTFTNN